MQATRRGFIGTIIGGAGLMLPHNVGKIVEPTKREIAQVMDEKPKGVAVVSGQEIVAESITWYADLEIWERSLNLRPEQCRLEIDFVNQFGQIETIRVSTKRNVVHPV